ncbi:putative UDP-N-acetylglucosamine--peptide N-acetylglucosaminyltransferase SPINDLY [Artemisia annua]|uniref:Putative UDP-N-acetylglucosamine--peptide N-acetylglucosaminyltransferase SPINDLY n=1 Tax=Artemisia annua TaxID=35608 RepID=A0A2U1KM14_ARTAN|nr:putative UDP-N-acetylglucosamine--peptide N-acetylglucosaminyltransferase SPINDLY [Artemisia annua]
MVGPTLCQAMLLQQKSWAVPNSRLILEFKRSCCDSVRQRFLSALEQLGLESLHVDLFPLILLMQAYSVMDIRNYQHKIVFDEDRPEGVHTHTDSPIDGAPPNRMRISNDAEISDIKKARLLLNS